MITKPSPAPYKAPSFAIRRALGYTFRYPGAERSTHLQRKYLTINFARLNIEPMQPHTAYAVLLLDSTTCEVVGASVFSEPYPTLPGHHRPVVLSVMGGKSW